VRRKDDEPDAIRNRLAVYQRQTAPVIDWYRTHGAALKFVDGMGTQDEVLTRIRTTLGL
jgi:adenylate kinase